MAYLGLVPFEASTGEKVHNALSALTSFKPERLLMTTARLSTSMSFWASMSSVNRAGPLVQI
jgi:hypothetical protein